MQEQLLKPSEVIKAYIAGIIDGEGSFGIYSKTRGAGGTKGKKRYIIFQLCMYDPEPLLLINKYYGFIIKKRSLNLSKYRGYVLVGRGRKLGEFINDIIPYLLHKRVQAELLLEVLKYKQNYTNIQKHEAEFFYDKKEEECKRLKNIYTQLPTLENSKEIDLSLIKDKNKKEHLRITIDTNRPKQVKAIKIYSLDKNIRLSSELCKQIKEDYELNNIHYKDFIKLYDISESVFRKILKGKY